MSWLRENKVDLSRYLPDFLKSDKELASVLSVESDEHDRQRLMIQDLFAQLFVETSTWGLKDWERNLAIAPDSADTYAQRRNRILLYLQSHQTSTVPFLESLADRYIDGGETKIVERNEENCFIVDIINQADLSKLRIDLSGAHEALDLYKPAHLAYYLVIQPGNRLSLNSAGETVTRVIPDKRWIETQRHTIFPTGLNASGAVSTNRHSATSTQSHSDTLFMIGTLNGRIRLNNAAYDVDENNIISYRSGLNAVKSRVKKWLTSKTTEWLEKGFARPPYALNRIGTVTTSWQDIGHDAEQTETLFAGSCLNRGKPRRTERKQTSTTTIRGTVFNGSRLNGRKRCMLNNTASETMSKTSTTEKTIVDGLFSGSLLNGGIRLNAGKPETLTRTVHIPVWRNVKHYHGATLLNACRHSTKDIQIEHVTPGRTEKFFDPTRGTLLNNHAVLGYLRL